MYEHGPIIHSVSWPAYYYLDTSPSFERNCAITRREISTGMISRHLSPTSAPAKPIFLRYNVFFEPFDQRPGGGVKKGMGWCTRSSSIPKQSWETTLDFIFEGGIISWFVILGALIVGKAHSLHSLALILFAFRLLGCGELFPVRQALPWWAGLSFGPLEM